MGTVRFEREFGSPLHFKDVLYVLGLKKNLVSVSTLEDRGYEVIFITGKADLKPLNSRAMK